MEKFCLIKGKEGFGDRLQCLLEGIIYAEKTNRHLVLDWRDDDWCHNKTEDVSKYFTINGNSEFTRESFFEYYRKHRESLTVAPRDWVDKITDVDYQNYVYRKNLQFGRGNQILYKIATKGIPDFPHNIVVYPSSGDRSWSWKYISKLKLSNMMETEILCTYLRLGMTPRKYNVIHMRGGSKAWNGGHVGQKRLREKINAKFPTKDSYFDFLFKKYQKLDTSLPLLLLTDYEPMATEWIERYKCGVVIGDTHNSFFKKCGTHKIKPDEMQGLSKQTLCVETLRDFSMMINSNALVHDEISYLSNMAFGVRKRNLTFCKNESFDIKVKSILKHGIENQT
jgi:hypothetical protein